MDLKKGVIIFVASLLSAGCASERQPDLFRMEGITAANYPRVDCSTSTQLLQTLIACKLLGASYKWDENKIFGGYYDLLIDYSPKAPEEFFAGLKVSTTNGAFMNLIDGDADIIVVSRSISRDEKAYADQKGVALLETPIALDGFIFIGNRDNPVDNLTRRQIRDIYMGSIVNWNEVGGSDMPITPYIREPNSGSQEKMETIVMAGLEMPVHDYTSLTGMGGPFERLRLDGSGICYSLYYYNSYFVEPDLVKTFSVDGVSPTRQNIRNRIYPYTTEVYAAVRSDTDVNSMAYKLYELICSPNAKTVIEESGYVAK